MPPVVIAAGIAGAATIGGAVISSKGASKAADAQANAARDANSTQWEMYKQSRSDRMPWYQAGKLALGDLGTMIKDGPGELELSPGYQWRKEEGERAINRGLNARGLYGSGKALKDLTRFNQGLASDEYGRFISQWINTKLNPTQSLAGIGQTAAETFGLQGLATGQITGQNTQAAGQARASGYANQANIVNQGLQGIGNVAGMYLGNRPPSSAPSGGLQYAQTAPQQPYTPQTGFTYNSPTFGQI